MTGEDWREVVGVVDNVKHFQLNEEPLPKVFIPYAQAQQPFLHRMMSSLSFISIRTGTSPVQLAGAVRAAVHEVDPDQPVVELKPLEQLVLDSVAQDRMQGSVLSLLAGLALVVAAIGLYGVVNYAVQQRTRELGLRLALGAETKQLARAVIARSMGTAAIGSLVGVAAAGVLARTLELGLYEIHPLDPLTYVAVVALISTVAFAACLVPARRATKIEPMAALRHD